MFRVVMDLIEKCLTNFMQKIEYNSLIKNFIEIRLIPFH